MKTDVVSDEWEDLLGSGVRRKVIIEGAGVSPDFGSLVLFNWKGRLLQADGTSGFSFAERSRVTTRIGDGDEIPGLELALRHMQEGQQSLIRCDSRFAYGPDGCRATKPGDKDVLPDADIEMHVELLRVLSTTPLSGMTLEEKVTEGQRKKAIGNEHFARKAYKHALRSYTSACNTIADAEIPDKESKVFLEARQLRIDCGNNIATTCVRLGELEKAKNATVEVLELDPVNTKALFRAGQVSSLQSNFVEANLALRKALELNPESREIQAELRLLLERTKAYKTKKHNMQEVMGKSLLTGSRISQKVPKGSTNNPATPILAPQNASTSGEETGETAASGPRGGRRARAPMALIFGYCQSMSEYVIVALVACVIAYLVWQSARW